MNNRSVMHLFTFVLSGIDLLNFVTVTWFSKIGIRFCTREYLRNVNGQIRGAILNCLHDGSSSPEKSSLNRALMILKGFKLI